MFDKNKETAESLSLKEVNEFIRQVVEVEGLEENQDKLNNTSAILK
jgi:hypothetical protein